MQDFDPLNSREIGVFGTPRLKTSSKISSERTKQAYTGVVAVAVKVQLNKLPKSELTAKRAQNKAKARTSRKTAKSAEQISAIKRNQNIYNDVPAISLEVVKTLRLSTHRTSIILGKMVPYMYLKVT